MISNNALSPGWRKASYSNGTGSCVEVSGSGTTVLVRDTKQRYMRDTDRTIVSFSPEAWKTAVASIKNGELA